MPIILRKCGKGVVSFKMLEPFIQMKSRIAKGLLMLLSPENIFWGRRFNFKEKKHRNSMH